ncbi:hypothetical protein [Corynebacterium uterequi]|uniref:Uncharacterized protein n=1 Tax=Corynebacterium uterequi TaxID=1072256 RepID=A0A0G3HDZ1_9CORY|nr:hypothetical protein [Corynebacterium uterequi]AKK11586.1 hypothetical protein CUTER_08005 [Corynebacterium uterequi]
MHKIAAELRHRELTQEMYNIGDEVAEYIEHLIEAIRDFDAELTGECLAEFEEIAGDARIDSRRIVGELIGLRQALTSGVAAGALSADDGSGALAPEPELLDGDALVELFPVAALPQRVSDLAVVAQDRTDLTCEHLEEVVEYVLQQTDLVARNLQSMSLPHLYSRAATLVGAAVEGWQRQVADAFPSFARTMRGTNPPTFLGERARINAVVARVAARKAAAGRNFAS